MNYECYHDGKPITMEEIVKGQIALDKANRLGKGEFEGWVHCDPNENAYLHEDDEELKAFFKDWGIEYPANSIIVHEEDVREVYNAERKNRPDELQEWTKRLSISVSPKTDDKKVWRDILEVSDQIERAIEDEGYVCESSGAGFGQRDMQFGEVPESKFDKLLKKARAIAEPQGYNVSA